MPELQFPRNGIMNHQTGRSCYAYCVVAVCEFYLGNALANRGNDAPGTWLFKDIERFHMQGTTKRDQVIVALKISNHFSDFETVTQSTDAMQKFNAIKGEIDASRPVLGSNLDKTAGSIGHVYLIYGYTLPDELHVCDPVLGRMQSKIAEVKSHYAGFPERKWQRLYYTQP